MDLNDQVRIYLRSSKTFKRMHAPSCGTRTRPELYRYVCLAGNGRRGAWVSVVLNYDGHELSLLKVPGVKVLTLSLRTIQTTCAMRLDNCGAMTWKELTKRRSICERSKTVCGHPCFETKWMLIADQREEITFGCV